MYVINQLNRKLLVNNSVKNSLALYLYDTEMFINSEL